MAQRWTFEEDYIVCKYCIENRWAYSSDVDVENIKALLEQYGYLSRSNLAVKKRARNYEYMIGGTTPPSTTNQEREVLEVVYSAIQKSNWIERYVEEEYRPGETTDDLDYCITGKIQNSSQYLPIEPIEIKKTFYEVLDELLEKYYEKHKEDKKTRGAVKKQFKDSLVLTYGVSIDTFNSIRREKYETVSRRILFRICFALELDYEDVKRLLESIGYGFRHNKKEEVVIEGIFKCSSPRRFIISEIDDTLKRNGCRALFCE